ncbi:hypothetical protein ABI59_06645 [Acidobacteria bacterium Mor1]|nr:hypothetical protein ABI59_06645 [Acidobacteria bacterium Mor1]
MSKDDPIDALPWYVNDTLSAEERRSVEERLRDSPEYRAALEDLRGITASAKTDPGRLDADVHPDLLLAYAEDRTSLDPELRARVERGLERSQLSREALEILREVDASIAAAPAAEISAPRESVWAGIWQTLRATLLAPAPALAYLLVLAVLVPLALRDTPDGPALSPFAVPQRVIVESERAVRGDAATAAPLSLPAAAEALLLELRTDLIPQDLEDGLALELVLFAGDRELTSSDLTPSDFVERDGRLTVSVPMFPQLLPADGDLQIAIRARKPGSPLDGKSLFRRSLALVPGGPETRP